MKILRVISSMHPKGGGPCQGIRNSIPALEKLGVFNEVVCLDDPKSDYIGKDSFKIYAIGPSKGPWAYSASLIPWIKLNASNFDAIIVHGLWQFTSYAVFKASKKMTIPYFVMPHGMLDPYFQKASERRFKAIRNWLFWKFIEGKIISHAAGVLFTCQEELMLAREAFKPYLPKKELNVGYGIQEPPKFNSKMTDTFKNNCPNLNDRPFLLFLSRIHSKKGIDLLLDAYQQYISSNSYISIDLVIAGPGLESVFGKSLTDKVEKHIELRSNVHFTGMLSGDAKWGAFYNAEAFILPSHQENFGIAIVEALACGKPVLISNKVNIWREIENEEAGIVADDTFSGTLELISEWGKLPKKQKIIMAQQAKKTFFRHYAIIPAAGRLLSAIQKAIK